MSSAFTILVMFSLKILGIVPIGTIIIVKTSVHYICSIIIYNQGSGHFEGLAILWEDGTKVEAAATRLNDIYQMQIVRLSDAFFQQPIPRGHFEVILFPR